MIKKFRKKPVIIEAMQWCGDNFQELEEFGSQRHIISNPDRTLTIETLEGNHTAQKGDWIIKGVQGEVYPCKPDINQIYLNRLMKKSPKLKLKGLRPRLIRI